MKRQLLLRNSVLSAIASALSIGGVAHAEEQSPVPAATHTVTVTAEYVGEDLFEKQGLVVVSTPLEHFGASDTFGDWSLTYDNYSARGYRENDYGIGYHRICFSALTCEVDFTVWEVPGQTIYDYAANVSGGDQITWQLWVEHQEGETYRTNVFAASLADSIHVVPWLTAAGRMGIATDTDSRATQGFWQVSLAANWRWVTATLYDRGFESLSGHPPSNTFGLLFAASKSF